MLFLSYLSANESLRELFALGAPLHEITLFVFSFAVTCLSWRGLDVNGCACFVLTISVCLPFLVFSVIGLPSIDPNNFLLGPSRPNTNGASLPPDTSVEWGPLLNCLFWNLNVQYGTQYGPQCLQDCNTMLICVIYSTSTRRQRLQEILWSQLRPFLRPWALL